MLIAIVALAALGLVIGLSLGVAAKSLAVEVNPVAAEIEGMLPGSQCGQCGFAGCGQAANAIADGSAPPTACPPGGSSLAVKIAALMGIVLEVDGADDVRKVAFVEASKCIGCTKCYKVCPTDAIIGAPKQVHAVLSEFCTACGLCVDACPTETVNLQPAGVAIDGWRWPKPSPSIAA